MTALIFVQQIFVTAFSYDPYLSGLIFTLCVALVGLIYDYVMS